MNRRSSSGSGHNQIGLKSPTSPGATSVWVGSRPSPDSATLRNGFVEDSKFRRQSSGSDNDGQYVVVSVRNSTSDSKPGSRKGSTVIPPSSSASFNTSISSAGHTGSSSSSGPFSPTSPPFGGLQFQPQPYLQNAALVGNSGTLLGNTAGNILGSTSALYNGGSFLPAATSSMAMLPQGGYDPSSLLLQQPLSPDLLAASLSQTLSLSQGHSLAALPQPQIPPLPNPYLGQPFDMLSAAVAANQAMMSTTLQSPMSPVFSPTVINPQLMPLGTTAGLPSTLTGLPIMGQGPLGVSSPPPFLADPPSKAPRANRESFTNAGVPSLDVGGQKRPLYNSSSFDHGDDQTTSGVGSSVPSSPSDYSPTSPYSDLHLLAGGDEAHVQDVRVEPCYDRPHDMEACMRCGKKVYAMERLGPVKDVLYHKTCFTCSVCHTTLNLKNFHHNDADMADLNIYCGSHKPNAKAIALDSHAFGIQQALNVPRQDRINDQIRGGPEASKNTHMDSNSVSIRAAMHVPAPTLQASIKQREGAWFREERKYERMPPQDVVRHDGNEQEYEGSRSLYINPG